jgi:hypothetical protein
MLRRHSLEDIALSAEDISSLRRKALTKSEICSFSSDPTFFAMIAALGIQREVGTANDELARFDFDSESGQVVPKESLRARLIRYRRKIGVRIWAEGYPKLELRFYGIQALLHPGLSFNQDGTLEKLVIFPEIISKIASLEGVDLAFVRPWALNSVFELHPFDTYYLTNIWELKNLDALRFATLVENRQIPFLGTHDLVAHIAGTQSGAWSQLQARGKRVKDVLSDFLADTPNPWIGSLILPYIAGILLDDLAQPPVYEAETRSIPLEYVLQAIESRMITPDETGVLMKYPAHHEKIIELARFGSVAQVRAQAKGLVQGLINEIRSQTVVRLNEA